MTKIGPTTFGAGAMACSVGSVKFLRQRLENRVICGSRSGYQNQCSKLCPMALPTLSNCVSTYLKIKQHATSSMLS